jgi:hypothetical protein
MVWWVWSVVVDAEVPVKIRGFLLKPDIPAHESPDLPRPIPATKHVLGSQDNPTPIPTDIVIF